MAASWQEWKEEAHECRAGHVFITKKELLRLHSWGRTGEGQGRAGQGGEGKQSVDIGIIRLLGAKER